MGKEIEDLPLTQRQIGEDEGVGAGAFDAVALADAVAGAHDVDRIALHQDHRAQAAILERADEAEARATQDEPEAIAKGDVQAINYFVAQKYTEALAKIGSATNSKVVLMPMEASSLIGTLGGIAELAKDAMAKQGAAAPPVKRP